MLHSNLIPKENYEALAPEKKEEYVSMAIKMILRDNIKTGLTAREIEDSTYFHRNTVSKHLSRLVSTREVYVNDDKKKGGVFHINGNPEHPAFTEDIFDDENKRQYSISILENKFNQFIYIQEIAKNAYAKPVISGGILVSPKRLDALIQGLQKIKSQIDNTGGGNNDPNGQNS